MLAKICLGLKKRIRPRVRVRIGPLQTRRPFRFLSEKELVTKRVGLSLIDGRFGRLHGEDLGDAADALRAARAEEEAGAGPHQFRVLHEAEEARGRVVGADAFGRQVDALDDGRLADAPQVHRRLEADVDAGRVEQHHHLHGPRRRSQTARPRASKTEERERTGRRTHRGLEEERAARLEVGGGEDHAVAQVRRLRVQRQRGALAGAHAAARRLVALDRLDLATPTCPSLNQDSIEIG